MKTGKIRQQPRGVIVPVLTPFRQDKSIDFATLEKLIDWLCEKKTHALFPMGGSGEYQTLSTVERKKMIDTVLQVNGERRICFAGTGGKNPAETIELSEYAQSQGADGVGVVIPDFIAGHRNAIFAYFQTIDRAVSIPMMVYDPRGEGDYSLTPGLMRRMINELQNLAGIKYRTTNAENMGNMAREITAEINLLSGNEATFLQDLAVGAVGCVGGGANFYPDLMWQLQNRFEQGNFAEARRIQFQILEAIQVLNRVYWPLSGKIVLRELGIPFQFVTRVPGKKVSGENVSFIREYYRRLLKI
ncbi:MAG TPA: dihydrodipicolinate synthase family protein [Bacteroidetes bacterium]|nr:dihydrodipicolinate synthase family protein [Bacteroidota bacterium]